MLRANSVTRDEVRVSNSGVPGQRPAGTVLDEGERLVPK
jgi:hypothetical protein